MLCISVSPRPTPAVSCGGRGGRRRAGGMAMRPQTKRPWSFQPWTISIPGQYVLRLKLIIGFYVTSILGPWRLHPTQYFPFLGTLWSSLIFKLWLLFLVIVFPFAGMYRPQGHAQGLNVLGMDHHANWEGLWGGGWQGAGEFLAKGIFCISLFRGLKWGRRVAVGWGGAREFLSKGKLTLFKYNIYGDCLSKVNMTLLFWVDTSCLVIPQSRYLLYCIYFCWSIQCGYTYIQINILFCLINHVCMLNLKILYYIKIFLHLKGLSHQFKAG